MPDDLIAPAVRWYLRYRLSLADVVEWMTERGISVDRSTVYIHPLRRADDRPRS